MGQTNFAGLITSDLAGSDKGKVIITTLDEQFSSNPTSNVQKIDKLFEAHNNKIVELGKRQHIITISAIHQSTIGDTDYFTATSSDIKSYINKSILIINFDKSNTGNVAININGLGSILTFKIDNEGNIINMYGGDIVKNRKYLFQYDNEKLIFLNVSDYVKKIASPTLDNFVTLLESGEIKDSGLAADKPNGVATLTATGKLKQMPVAADVGARSVNWTPNLLEVGGSNRNILINGDFTAPQNQRGQSSYPSTGYTIDCWKNSNGAGQSVLVGGGVTLRRTSIEYNPYWYQVIENYAAYENKTLTISVLYETAKENSFWIRANCNGGNYSETLPATTKPEVFSYTFDTGTVPNNLFEIWVQNCAVVNNANPQIGDQIKLYAAKLEFGSQQTLARRGINGAWQLADPPPDPQQELARCQRYQNVLGPAAIYAGSLGAAATAVMFFVPLPVKLRNTPAISGTMTVHVFAHSGAYSSRTLTGCSATLLQNGIRVLGTLDVAVGTSAYAMVNVQVVTSPFIIDSNL